MHRQLQRSMHGVNARCTHDRGQVMRQRVYPAAALVQGVISPHASAIAHGVAEQEIHTRHPTTMMAWHCNAAKRSNSTVVVGHGGRGDEVVAGYRGTLPGGATRLVVLACTRRHSSYHHSHIPERLHYFKF